MPCKYHLEVAATPIVHVSLIKIEVLNALFLAAHYTLYLGADMGK